MAYSNNVIISNLGKGRLSVTITETEAAATSEAVITGIPITASLLKQVCVITSGTGATVNPILGAATNPGGANIIVQNETAAAVINNLASPAIPFATATGTIYHRSNVNAGADNSIISRYLFKGEW